MRNSIPFLCTSALLAGALLLGGCSTLGSGILGGLTCNPGTQVQLASPTSNQTGVSPGIGSITIVANGNNNTLYSTYNQWQITLTDNFGGSVSGSQLSLVPDPSGPHPYPSDFYYSSSIGQLTAGRTWTVYLVENNNLCSPDSLGSFST